jgi:predicted P-loop ATPase
MNKKTKQPQPEKPKNQKNYVAYVARNTMAIEKNLNTNLRIPVLKRACELLYRFDDYLQEQAINEWIEKFNLSKKLLLGFLNGESKPELSKADELKEYLLTFDIRQNEVTGEIIIEKNKKRYTLDELKLILDIENYDIKHLDKLLDSGNKNITVTKQFNPLNDFFLSLADKYKGEQLISELAACIPAMEFGDKPDGSYQKRLEYFLRKWLYKAAGQALGITKNDAMLLWIEGTGGSGKSRINQWLFSLPEFDNYYLQIKENAAFIDMAGISKGKFIVDWDELPLPQKRYLMFKSYIASENMQTYNKKSKVYETFTRRVNFIGSTNKCNKGKQPGFLIDDDDAMKRRIIPIELFGRIDYQRYLKSVDLYQLWGEAAAGILQAQKANNKDLLTWENDWNDLREQNNRYVNSKEFADDTIFFRFFKPANFGEGRLISASDMLLQLSKNGIKTKYIPATLGRLLSEKYNKGRKGNYFGYWIKEKTDN